MATAVFLIGIGRFARALVEEAKERRIAGERPIAYYALTTHRKPEGERASSLLPIMEDEKLEPVSKDISGVPAIDDESDDSYTAYILSDEIRANRLRLIAKGLFTPERGEAIRDLEVYLFVDMADPISVVAPHFMDHLLALPEHLAGQNVQVRVCLLAPSADSPYVYFVLKQVSAYLGKPVLRGMYLLEESAEHSERWEAIAEWLHLVLSGRHSPPDSRAKVGSFGLARFVVPQQEVEELFAHRLASLLLQRLQAPAVKGREEEAEPFLQPLLEITEPSRPATGELAPSTADQQVHCRLYWLGESPDLYSSLPVVEEVRAHIQGQETSGVRALDEKLRTQAESVQERRHQALNRRRWEVLIREGVEGLSRRVGAWSTKLAALVEQASNRVRTLDSLLKQGRYQVEEPPPPVWPTLGRMSLLSVAIGLVIGILFASGVTAVLGGALWLRSFLVGFLSPFLPLIVIQALFYGALVLFTLFPYLWLRIRGREEATWEPPPFEPMSGGKAVLVTLLLTTLLGVGFWRWGLLSPFQEVWGLMIALWFTAFLAEVLWFLWPTVRLYEFFALFPPQETSSTYPEAEERIRRALRTRSSGLAISRAAFLLITGIGILLAIGHYFEGTGWESLNLLLTLKLFALPAWFREGMLLLVLLAALKCVADILVAHYFLTRRGLSWPPRSRFWYYTASSVLGTSALAGGFLIGRHPIWLGWPTDWEFVRPILGVALWAIVRFPWECWNDETRVRQLVVDWVEWHDRMAYVKFHRTAWETAQRLYESLQAKVTGLQEWLSDLRDILAETTEKLEGQIEDLQSEIIQRQGEGMPRFLDLQIDLDELYRDLNLEALLDEDEWVDRWGLALEEVAHCGDEKPLVEALSPGVIEEMEKQFWRGRTALDFLTSQGYPDREGLAQERADFFGRWPGPFWQLETGADAQHPREVFVGLPGLKQRDITLERDIALLTPLPKGRGLPTFFEEERWGVSAIFYQTDVLSSKDLDASSPPLPSLGKWRQAYQSLRRRYQGKKRRRIPSTSGTEEETSPSS